MRAWWTSIGGWAARLAGGASLAMVAALALGCSAPATETAEAPEAAPVPVRLYVLDGGTLESDPGRYELTLEDVGVTELSVAAYLVEHPNGLLMWDTGGVSDDEWTPTGEAVRQHLVLSDGQDRYVTIARTIGEQLRAAGHEPADVTHLAMSHYHWDHTANANLFAGATWLVRQAERDAMFGENVGTSRPALFAALEDGPTVIVGDDEYDVFGDGSVVLKAAPGHTPGHQVLLVRLPETGPVVLSGDLYHYEAERTLDKVPTFEFDADQTRASRVSVEQFLERTGARLWIQHDWTAHAALRKAPDYYQ